MVQGARRTRGRLQRTHTGAAGRRRRQRYEVKLRFSDVAVAPPRAVAGGLPTGDPALPAGDPALRPGDLGSGSGPVRSTARAVRVWRCATAVAASRAARAAAAESGGSSPAPSPAPWAEAPGNSASVSEVTDAHQEAARPSTRSARAPDHVVR